MRNLLLWWDFILRELHVNNHLLFGVFLAPSSPETVSLNKPHFFVFSIQFFHILWESSGTDEAANTFRGFQPLACHCLSMVGEGLDMGIQEGLLLCAACSAQVLPGGTSGPCGKREMSGGLSASVNRQ